MPRLPTYESSRTVFSHSDCSSVVFHCQVLGRRDSRFKAAFGAPLEVEKQGSVWSVPQKVGSALVSNRRVPLMFALNGGTPAIGRYGDTRSRWKYWPTPARKTVFAVPKMSHAKPTRGATVL